MCKVRIPSPPVTRRHLAFGRFVTTPDLIRRYVVLSLQVSGPRLPVPLVDMKHASPRIREACYKEVRLIRNFPHEISLLIIMQKVGIETECRLFHRLVAAISRIETNAHSFADIPGMDEIHTRPSGRITSPRNSHMMCRLSKACYPQTFV